MVVLCKTNIGTNNNDTLIFSFITLCYCSEAIHNTFNSLVTLIAGIVVDFGKKSTLKKAPFQRKKSTFLAKKAPIL